MSTKTPYFVDEVFALDTRPPNPKDPKKIRERYLITQPSPKFHAKDRSGCLEPEEFPHMGYLIDKIQNDTKKKQ